MIYKFRSPATGDVIMLGPHGDHLLSLLGREPAAKGIIEAADMPGAITALQAAVEADDAARRRAAEPADDNGSDDAAVPAGLPLRQRLWPMIEMLKRAQAAGEPIVWGV